MWEHGRPSLQNIQDWVSPYLFDYHSHTFTLREFGMRISQLALVLLVLAFNPAYSQGFLKSGPSVFNYNYIDLKYVDVETTDGVNLQLSADVRDNTAFGVNYYRGSDGPVDADTLGLSLSYYIKARALRETDWIFGLGYSRVEVGSFDDNGLDVSAGLRKAIHNALEVNASFNISTIGDTDASLNFRALYDIDPRFSALVEVGFDDTTDLGIGIRYYWN